MVGARTCVGRGRVGMYSGSIAPIVEFCDVSVTNKGIYVKPGLQPPAGERKLYLLIEGDAERKVKMAASQVLLPALPPPMPCPVACRLGRLGTHVCGGRPHTRIHLCPMHVQKYMRAHYICNAHACPR